MRYISLVLITSILCCYAAETNDSASQATALKVASIMKKNDEAVQKINEIALKDLRKLLLANKKNKNDCVLIALKINKLDKNDKDAIELIKDIPIESRDLLGEQGNSDKYISEVKAKLIVDALAKGKFTGKDWDSLPGSGEKATPKPKVLFETKAGHTYLIVPHIEDKWRAADETGWANWTSMRINISLKDDSSKDNGTTLIDGKGLGILLKYPFDAKVTEDTSYGTASSKGFIRVKIYEVVPLE